MRVGALRAGAVVLAEFAKVSLLAYTPRQAGAVGVAVVRTPVTRAARDIAEKAGEARVARAYPPGAVGVAVRALAVAGANRVPRS